ncbi:hypothetical protein BDW74DRAFT_186201 [Aspergillus multicolor]|uniref:uncharacterized protein n=1 Tax=Aspergillus multicolor TaxID=41759 RepID=UPI003CCCC7DA
MAKANAQQITTAAGDKQLPTPFSNLPKPQAPPIAKRGWKRFLDCRHIAGVLWLGPAITLLVLNFKGHIIGLGLGCSGDCGVNTYAPLAEQADNHRDRTNRNILGLLQFVAKGLEIWFMYLAGSLIYTIAKIVSAKDSRLPVDILLIFAEFMDLLYIADLGRSMWSLDRQKRRAANTGSTEKTSERPWMLYSFGLFVAVLCAVGNLMGIATAALVIPGLQWMEVNRNDSIRFGEMLSSSAPGDEFFASNSCTEGIYNCTDNIYGPALDGLVSSLFATGAQNVKGVGERLTPLMPQEANLTIKMFPDVLMLVPNRGTLRQFNSDRTNWAIGASSRDSLDSNSAIFNRSLQTRLQRTGPAALAWSECNVIRAPRVIGVSQDKQVRCYDSYDYAYGNVGTKCIPWGSGWDHATGASSATFSIQNFVHQSYPLQVTVYTTPKARWIYDGDPCRIYDRCEWDQLFADANVTEPNTMSQQTYEYFMPQYANDSMIWCHSHAFLAFTTYALDKPSAYPDFVQLVEMRGTDYFDSNLLMAKKGDPEGMLSVHADWLLAAWAVNNNGSVSGYRASSLYIIDAYKQYIAANNSDSNIEDPVYNFELIHSTTILQTYSILPYSTTTRTSVHRDPHKGRDEEKLHTLSSWASVQLWKYGIDSRTKVLGVVVLAIGMVVVVVTTLLWSEAPDSPIEMIVTALVQVQRAEEQSKDEPKPQDQP